ncbi:sugar transferase [Guptibacillus hwajinpoensis]|uniref:Multidrug MFS transporter n=1 Tax=Guptibacillus hwajinpoensis TaxID=208199 RepID=A0A0J6CXG2_9BACL|nr:sugar transferase [Alkalihalobacillus macyae]KMM36729.1 multidrug MFS transporter [Alkalihalobacillus macyae]
MSKSNLEIEAVKSYPASEPVTPSQLSAGYYAAKRVMDIVAALIALLLLSPLMAIIMVISIFDRGPIFFKQQRFGKDGVPFSIYKFRSMVTDAEQVLKKDETLYQKYVTNNFKLEPDEDPRITKLGRFLRKTSLDEIPQLINVLKGDMSLVGPRPIVNEELQQYGNKQRVFLSVKPGMTGYWQISGRSAVGYPERIDVELFYVYNQSIKMDIKIIIGTFSAVLKKRGAY